MTICGANCEQCRKKQGCKGCMATDGHPFGGTCVAAECIKRCGKDGYAAYKARLIDEFNALRIPRMPTVTELTELPGKYINLEYPMGDGEHVYTLLDDSRVYLGYQLEQENSERCFGVVADEKGLLVCEYGRNGSDPEIIAYRRRKP